MERSAYDSVTRCGQEGYALDRMVCSQPFCIKQCKSMQNKLQSMHAERQGTFSTSLPAKYLPNLAAQKLCTPAQYVFTSKAYPVCIHLNPAQSASQHTDKQSLINRSISKVIIKYMNLVYEVMHVAFDCTLPDCVFSVHDVGLPVPSPLKNSSTSALSPGSSSFS